MKLLFIISSGALFLLLTSSAEAATPGGIEPSIEILNALETRQESLKGCSMSSLDKCYGTVPPDGSVPNDLLEEIGHISDAQTCQRFCNELYNGTCQWFMFDKTTEDCKLFSSSLNDLWNDCREVGYAREPDHELCDEMFSSDSSNGCYNFREDYCRFEFSLLENLEEIDSLSECQLACQYINNCSYFVYDSPSKICKLNTQLSQKTCDIIHGTPQPDLNTCISGGKIDWASNSGQPLTATERPALTTTATTTTTTTPTTTTVTGDLYVMVTDGICPSGYSSTVTETECRGLPGKTISNITMVDFHHAGCQRDWTPAHTCFSYEGIPYYVTRDCGHTPKYASHRLICKNLGYRLSYVKKERNVYCPSGSEITNAEECRDALSYAAELGITLRSRRTLIVAENTSSIPNGCSYQIGGDSAFHFNKNCPRFCIGGDYAVICKRPA